MKDTMSAHTPDYEDCNCDLFGPGHETKCPRGRLIAAAPRMLALLEEYAAKAKDVTNPAPGSLIERTRTILREIEGQRPDVEGGSNG